jgi:hypothetical protein
VIEAAFQGVKVMQNEKGAFVIEIEDAPRSGRRNPGFRAEGRVAAVLGRPFRMHPKA